MNSPFILYGDRPYKLIPHAPRYFRGVGNKLYKIVHYCIYDAKNEKRYHYNSDAAWVGKKVADIRRLGVVTYPAECVNTCGFYSLYLNRVNWIDGGGTLRTEVPAEYAVIVEEVEECS